MLPTRRVLGDFIKNEEKCVFWLRDAYRQSGTDILEISQHGVGVIPNVSKWWAEVDAKAVSDFLNVLGYIGKSENIEFHTLSQNRDEWDANIICIGSQYFSANKIFNDCDKVYYKINNRSIIKTSNNQIIKRERGYGYGIILKAWNPHKLPDGGNIFLIGGFGTLGTEVAGYYFRNNHKKLGKKFGDKCFGVVVRASVSGGPQTVERLEQYDIREEN